MIHFKHLRLDNNLYLEVSCFPRVHRGDYFWQLHFRIVLFSIRNRGSQILWDTLSCCSFKKRPLIRFHKNTTNYLLQESGPFLVERAYWLQPIKNTLNFMKDKEGEILSLKNILNWTRQTRLKTRLLSSFCENISKSL